MTESPCAGKQEGECSDDEEDYDKGKVLGVHFWGWVFCVSELDIEFVVFVFGLMLESRF